MTPENKANNNDNSYHYYLLYLLNVARVCTLYY